MDGTRQIQVIVAWLDMIAVRAAQVLAVVILTCLLLWLAWRLRTWIEDHTPPRHWIDYDAPGVDITSEGPEDGDPWYDTPCATPQAEAQVSGGAAKCARPQSGKPDAMGETWFTGNDPWKGGE